MVGWKVVCFNVLVVELYCFCGISCYLGFGSLGFDLIWVDVDIFECVVCIECYCIEGMLVSELLLD